MLYREHLQGNHTERKTLLTDKMWGMTDVNYARVRFPSDTELNEVRGLIGFMKKDICHNSREQYVNHAKSFTPVILQQ